MGEVDAHKELVLKFLRALECRDLKAIEALLAQNFHDWSSSSGDMSRCELLRYLELQFETPRECDVKVLRIVSEGDAVAVEMSICMDVDNRRVELIHHDLFLFEQRQIIGIREYGEGAS